MGRRSDFRKIPKDKYYTIDPNAVPETFLDFIRGQDYAEPCFGGGDLEGLIGNEANCVWRSDMDPDEDVPCLQKDATTLTEEDLKSCSVIVTNPPYSWDLLQPLLDHLPTLKPTWLLLPANVMHNKRMGPYMGKCSWVVSVGRLYWVKSIWVEGLRNPQVGTYTGWWEPRSSKPTKSEVTRGTEDYCWYCWDYNNDNSITRFIGRT